MARESIVEETVGGRLNNKTDLNDDVDLLQCAIRRRRRRTEKIGKNSYCHHQRQQQKKQDRRRRSMLQLVPFFSQTRSGRIGSTTGTCSPFSKMILLPIYLGLLSQVGIFAGGVEGNGEIESCVVQTRSSSAAEGVSGSGGSNGLGYYSGSSPVQNNGVGGISGAGASDSGVGGTNNGLLGGGVGGGGNINNNKEPAALIDPHSVILCHIRTLHPDLMENLTSSISSSGVVEGGAGITKLKLVCNDVLFFESNVSAGQFQMQSFSDLHDLTIEKCKLPKIPDSFLAGLRHLRKLTINTGNTDWAARSLQLENGALSTDTNMLRHINLAYNAIWSIPGGVLCKQGKLQVLNVSHNLLSEIEDLGLPGRPAMGNININSGEFDQTSVSSIPEKESSGSSLSSTEGSSCLAELKSLDLSSNSLRNLGNRRLENLKRLQELRLQDNWLEELEDDALHGLGALRLLNLSSNRLVALPIKLFQPCKLLREMDLSNNSLAALSPGLFNGLEHLQVLELSMNRLSSNLITTHAFNALVRLVVLDLSHNELTHLEKSTFQSLFTLQILDLSNNLISSISDDTFAPMTNLHSLNLSRNRLVNINSNMFNGLYVLHKMILDYNQISTIQVDAMKNCTSLQDLGLVGNSLQDIPQALRGLSHVRTLDLGDNKIKNLHNESFLGMGQLIGLRLVDNQLEEIPKGLCDSMSKLRVLNLAQNRIHKISSQAFYKCPDLRVLRLDSNKLEEIPSTLAPQLPNLLWLNISENQIQKLSLLPTSLEWLDVSHNQLESLGGAWSNNNPSGAGWPASGSSNNPSAGSTVSGNTENKNNMLMTNAGSILPRTSQQNGNTHNNHHHPHQSYAEHPNSKLRVVDASFNKLTFLDHHAIPPHVEVFRVSHNRLTKISDNTFSRSSNLRRVELIGNQLERIALTALRLPPITKGKPLPEFFLAGNPLLCNCDMEYLLRINIVTAGALRQHPLVLDIDQIVCRLSYSRTITHIPLPEIKSQDFLCPYKSHCFALCHCCDFDACDCEMTCPTNCSCYHDNLWSQNVVDCAGAGHTAIPSRLPMDSTEVYLDGNAIKVLKSHTFIGRKNLRILFLNNSQIETISNKTFNGLQSIQTLYLHENRLTKLHGFEFDHLTRLRELYLQDNLIETISNTTFLPLKSLEILRLDGNRLVVFTVWQLSLNPYLVEIGLARNQWNCDCQFLHQLYGWVTDNSRKISDLVQLQCVWNTTHKPGPHLIDYNRTCASSWALLENRFDFNSFSALHYALFLVVLATLLILVIALVIICRENLSLYLFTRFNGFRLCAAADYEDDKSYDSYLIYSQKDEEFVAQRIADELETNDNYRLCLHYRDLICETGDLKEMMIGAVDNSKSVLIILSRNFLQGEWSSGEYRSAFHAVLKKSQRGGGGFGGGSASKTPPKKILIVFIEDIPKVEINPDIRSWVRHNRIKVIKWNIHSTDYGKNRKFWNKLKFVLPDASSQYHSNITSNTTTTSASSNENHGGIMATLKYSTTLHGDSHLHHPISHPHHHNNIQHHPAGHLPHQQIIVDESGRFTTTTTGGPPPISSSQTNTLNSIKYWPYGATNFVALPPKYQASHHSSSAGSHPPSVNSPGSAQSLHYHPPLPLTNPPKSPPSSQSTDSTTTTMADDAPSLMSQLTMASFHSATNGPSSGNNVSATKSPVPVPKSSYSSSPRNIMSNNSVNNSIMLANASNSSNNGSGGSSSSSTTSNNVSGGINNTVGGESYLSIDDEHVYSTLDPPSPQPVQQSMSLMSQNILGNGGSSANFLNNIHLPNGYTYQPQSTLHHHHHHPQQQWHGSSGGSNYHPQHLTSTHQQSSNIGIGGGGKHHHQQQQQQHKPVSSFVGSPSNKGYKQKDGNNSVQTYLV